MPLSNKLKTTTTFKKTLSYFRNQQKSLDTTISNRITVALQNMAIHYVPNSLFIARSVASHYLSLVICRLPLTACSTYFRTGGVSGRREVLDASMKGLRP
jgi:hypothetical protein